MPVVRFVLTIIRFWLLRRLLISRLGLATIMVSFVWLWLFGRFFVINHERGSYVTSY